MSQSTNYQLIDGTFSPEDAQVVLTALITGKINFHQMEKFGIEERTGGDVSHSEQRIVALKAMHQSVKELISQAKEQNVRLKIDGTISITRIND